MRQCRALCVHLMMRLRVCFDLRAGAQEVLARDTMCELGDANAAASRAAVSTMLNRDAFWSYVGLKLSANELYITNKDQVSAECVV